MSATRTYEFTYQLGQPKTKVLDKTKDGWYICNLGTLNGFNAHGEYYAVDNAKEIFFGPNSVLARKQSKGLLYGEMGHPVIAPGMSKFDYYMRNMRIQEDRISHCIRNIQFVQTDTVDECDGKRGFAPMIFVTGEVMPAGQYKDAVKDMLENPGLNTAFSIRSFTAQSMVNGILVKKLTNVITYDFVSEPGIPTATKFHTASSNESFTYNLKDLENILKHCKDLKINTLQSNEAFEGIKAIEGILDSKSNRYRSLQEWGSL